jgi:hypothetical protein
VPQFVQHALELQVHEGIAAQFGSGIDTARRGVQITHRPAPNFRPKSAQEDIGLRRCSRVDENPPDLPTSPQLVLATIVVHHFHANVDGFVFGCLLLAPDLSHLHMPIRSPAERHDNLLMPPPLQFASEERLGVVGDLVHARLIPRRWRDIRGSKQNHPNLTGLAVRCRHENRCTTQVQPPNHQNQSHEACPGTSTGDPTRPIYRGVSPIAAGGRIAHRAIPFYKLGWM